MKLNKTFFFFLLILPFLLTTCAGNPSAEPPVSFLDFVPDTPYTISEYSLDGSPEAVSGKPVFDYFIDEDIKVGWNLGNTLDSYIENLGAETVWGNPQINQELINGVKAAGYDIIRIPVTWTGHIGSPPNHRIAPRRLKRVADVVEMANNAGLKVIVNLHHDGSTSNGGRDNGWLSIGRASRNRNEYDRITTQYARVWQQIATYFQNYGDWLIFESFNELHDGNWGDGGDVGQLITLTRWNQLFVDIVRASGGNNETRYLLVSAYCKNRRQTLSSGFSMPNDTVPEKLIVSFHYYDPYELGIAGTRPSWGAAHEKQRIDNDFAPFKEHFIDKRIPVLVGECGAVLQLYPNNPGTEAQARQSRADYIQHIFATAGKYGLVPIYWDNGSTTGNGEKFGLFDRKTGQPNSPESGALIKFMVDAVR